MHQDRPACNCMIFQVQRIRNVTYCSKTDGDGNEQAWINWIITSELKHEDLIWLSCGPGGPWHDLDPSVLWMYNLDY